LHHAREQLWQDLELVLFLRTSVLRTVTPVIRFRPCPDNMNLYLWPQLRHRSHSSAGGYELERRSGSRFATPAHEIGLPHDAVVDDLQEQVLNFRTAEPERCCEALPH
jgi:hypothetical protein